MSISGATALFAVFGVMQIEGAEMDVWIDGWGDLAPSRLQPSIGYDHTNVRASSGMSQFNLNLKRCGVGCWSVGP